MEKRIALEKRGLPDEQIVELILDNCRSTSIEGLTDSFTALEVLSLINVGLVSLKSFPKLPSLRKLELSDNRISSGLNHLTGSPKLTHLNLSGNRIKGFEELKPLKELGKLEVLDLFNNEVTMTENYRDKIFELIPSLKYLDGFDKEDAEAPSDEEDGGGEEEEDNACFSINGIEIDLSELARFESRVKQKRAAVSAEDFTQPRQDLNGLESKLSQLELRQEEGKVDSSDEIVGDAKDDLDLLYEEIQNRNKQQQQQPSSSEPPSLGSLLLAFLSLLAFVNQICFAQQRQQLIENIDDSSSSSEDEFNISLAEVYNDNLDEEGDGSDWGEEEGEFEEDIDEPTDDEAEGDGVSDSEGAEEKVASDSEADDTEARGKKRKHEGNDG
ncbi:acidic leucine-rich nuclear phosphoprotein 32 family member A [Toxorhynchites rutilus septentrionalis]|uniref:acidic leucine-rich nuclear phosphoprotein 32 family member A n=1 Tax=Toxorhynchites rutilus septentrionalis TaxID=329112 RepID=UPI00247A0C4F|nr:acidic leucine-rich nuclear phosphoprotein 32 family member A [Toxorhynchites rutilus septentrionalis]XP_055631492.1 acidic leucine-rich nuclear phosphoprotein 32 family member A [Toxorhynchites rutilus septentrionalis]